MAIHLLTTHCKIGMRSLRSAFAKMFSRTPKAASRRQVGKAADRWRPIEECKNIEDCWRHSTGSAHGAGSLERGRRSASASHHRDRGCIAFGGGSADEVQQMGDSHKAILPVKTVGSASSEVVDTRTSTAPPRNTCNAACTALR